MWCVAWIPRSKDGLSVLSHTDVWCACLRQPKKHPKKYRDSIATKCGYYVTLPIGIEDREPTCEDCLEKLKSG